MIFSTMFITDCLVIGVGTNLLWSIHKYMIVAEASKQNAIPHTVASRHAKAHVRIAGGIMLSVAIYVALKVVDTLLQVASPKEFSPMEILLNFATAGIFIALALIIYHLAVEEDKDHPFYSLWHNTDAS